MIPFLHTKLTDGFWQRRQKLNYEVSIPSVYNRFQDTGRFGALRFDWKEGDPNRPHIFWDSDVYKWIEAAAYVLKQNADSQLELLIDETVGLIEKHQDDDGYFNTYFQVVEPERRFSDRGAHELYCAGHMIEAGVAYYRTTGKDTLLKCARRMADNIEQVFVKEQSAGFVTPGHEEIELALVSLYRCTGEKRYLELGRWFLDNRGNNEKDAILGWEKPAYTQSHLPVRQHETAEGHCVRACYLYSGMADVAIEDGDEPLSETCRKLFENIALKRMYITGGIGSSREGEAFTFDYDLPNATAYNESCAAIALAMFARRMSLLEPNSLYADVAERILYNGFLSGTSLDGRAFFYENPLEITLKDRCRNISVKAPEPKFPITQRVEVFECSCCPPNINRFVASVADYLYTCDSSTLFIHQFMAGETRFAMDGHEIGIVQKTKYPADSTVRIVVKGMNDKKVAVRVPGWCKKYTMSVNGQPVTEKPIKGYVYILCNSDNVTMDFNMDMPVYAAYAAPGVWENAGRIAVCRGPIVYCAEEVDNGENLHALSIDTGRLLETKLVYDEIIQNYVLEAGGYRETAFEGLYSAKSATFAVQTIRLIPYYAFANRGESDMLVWLRSRS